MLTEHSPSLPDTLSPDEIVSHDLAYICEQLTSEFRSLAGKSVLIAGGAGFLGYYLVQSLLHWNASQPDSPPLPPIRVTVLDNFIRGVPAWLAALDGDPHLRLLTHDITVPLPSNLGSHEYIIHAASIASPTFYRQRPIETMDANVNGLRFILDHCVRQKRLGRSVEGVLFYSSSEIYGDPLPGNIPTPETYRGNVSCTGPRACYDESKRFGETLCINFAAEYGLPIKIARPFNNYGPGLKISDRRVIPDFARDILAGRNLVMLSDGAARRTFCYVADAVCGYYKVLVRGRAGEPYNIGVETPEISMTELAGKLVTLGHTLFGYEGRVVHQLSADKDYLVDNPSRRCPVIAKARTEVGYRPGVPLDEGLKRSLLWYSINRSATDA